MGGVTSGLVWLIRDIRSHLVRGRPSSSTHTLCSGTPSRPDPPSAMRNEHLVPPLLIVPLGIAKFPEYRYHPAVSGGRRMSLKGVADSWGHSVPRRRAERQEQGRE